MAPGGGDELNLRLGLRLKTRRVTRAAEARGLRQNLAKTRTRAMEMRFRVADGPIEHRSDFRMFVALDVVKNDNELLRRAKLCERALEIKAIQRGRKVRVGRCQRRRKMRSFIMDIGGGIEWDFARGIAAKAHERKIYSDAVKPGRKRRVAAERTNFSKNEQESLLREVFGGGDISDDAETDGKNAGAVAPIDAFESGSVATLGACDDSGFKKLRFVPGSR